MNDLEIIYRYVDFMNVWSDILTTKSFTAYLLITSFDDHYSL